jgi:hypothetical protein
MWSNIDNENDRPIAACSFTDSRMNYEFDVTVMCPTTPTKPQMSTRSDYLTKTVTLHPDCDEPVELGSLLRCLHPNQGYPTDATQCDCSTVGKENGFSGSLLCLEMRKP